MDLLADLEFRGQLHQLTDPAGLREHLATPRRVYAGFDPTKDSLTIGNLVQILLLRRFQQAGHTPIVVTGPYYNPSESFGSRMGGYQLEKRKLIPRLVEVRQKAGDQNIHYVDGFELISPAQADALSDARHPNSYGMFLYARGLEPALRKALQMPVAPLR